jgi:hypothetical protein
MGQFIDAILSGAQDGAKSAAVKAALRISMFANLIIVIVLVKHFFPEMVPGGLALAAFSGALLGAIELELVGRLLGRPGWVFDFNTRATYIGTVGFAVAFLFALGLTVYELHDQSKANEMAQQMQAAQQQNQQQLQDIKKEFPRGLDDMNKILQDAKAKNDAAKVKPQAP